MTQATLRPNEFIIRVEEQADEWVVQIRNPHVDLGKDNTYDLRGLHYLASFLKAAAKLHQVRTKPLKTDESNSELHP